MSRSDVLPGDRVPSQEMQALPFGAHIVTPRSAYAHHGIYAGNGRVVHYGGLVRGLRAGPVEVVSLDEFTQGRPLKVLVQSSRFSSAEIVQRALSRVGENNYRVLTNNCEHFCEWCVRGEHRSYQVDRWLSLPLRAMGLAATVVVSGGARERDRWREKFG
jgi:hypothetical protein